jgi:hypothetical protein
MPFAEVEWHLDSLQSRTALNPFLVELDPAFTPEEEAFSRTNRFIEI